jgi:hypothetical protein
MGTSASKGQAVPLLHKRNPPYWTLRAQWPRPLLFFAPEGGFQPRTAFQKPEVSALNKMQLCTLIKPDHSEVLIN